MSLTEINNLRERLNALLSNENASKDEILALSRELDELILQFLKVEKK